MNKIHNDLILIVSSWRSGVNFILIFQLLVIQLYNFSKAFRNWLFNKMVRDRPFELKGDIPTGTWANQNIIKDKDPL